MLSQSEIKGVVQSFSSKGRPISLAVRQMVAHEAQIERIHRQTTVSISCQSI